MNFSISGLCQFLKHNINLTQKVKKNSRNSVWSSRTVRHVYETEDKVSVPPAQCDGAVIAKSGTEHAA